MLAVVLSETQDEVVNRDGNNSFESKSPQFVCTKLKNCSHCFPPALSSDCEHLKKALMLTQNTITQFLLAQDINGNA